MSVVLVQPIVSANIRSNPLQMFRHVRARIDMASGLAGDHSVVVGQEISLTKRTRGKVRREYDQIWSNQMREQGKGSTFANPGLAVSWELDEWRIMHVEVVFVHKQLAGVTPPRQILKVRMEHKTAKARGRAITMTMLCVWPVSGWYKRRVSAKGWRTQMKDLYREAMKRETREELALGVDLVVTAGDWNDPDPDPIHPDQVVLHRARLDHIVAVAGDGFKVRAGKHGQVAFKKRTGMDHPVVWGTAILELAA